MKKKTLLGFALFFYFTAPTVSTFGQVRPSPSPRARGQNNPIVSGRSMPDLRVYMIRHNDKSGSIDVSVSNVGGADAPQSQVNLKAYQNGVVTKEVVQIVPAVAKGAESVVNFSTDGWAAAAGLATGFKATVNPEGAFPEGGWANNTLYVRMNLKGKKSTGFVPFADYSIAGVAVVPGQTALKVSFTNNGKKNLVGGEMIVYALPKYVKTTWMQPGFPPIIEEINITGDNAEGNTNWAWATAKQTFNPLAPGASGDLVFALPAKKEQSAPGSSYGFPKNYIKFMTIITSPLTFEDSAYFIVIMPAKGSEASETLGDNSFFFVPSGSGGK